MNTKAKLSNNESFTATPKDFSEIRWHGNWVWLPKEGDEPALILLEAIKGGGVGTMWEEPPLVLYQGRSGRDYTDEARQLLYGKGSWELSPKC